MEKIRVNTKLINFYEKQEDICTTHGLKDNNRIIYYENDIKVVIEFNNNFLKIIRTSDEYILEIILNNKKSTITYNMKNVGILNIACNLIEYNLSNNSMVAIYEIINTNDTTSRFEFNLHYEVI